MTLISLCQHIMTKWGFSLQWPDMVSHLATRCLVGSSYCYFLHIVWSGNAWPRLWVKWHGMADKSLPGKAFQWNVHNIFLKYIWFSVPPQFFFNIVNVSGIEIHPKFTYPYHFYLNVTLLDDYISLHIDLFVTYFCSGNLWGGCFSC